MEPLFFNHFRTAHNCLDDLLAVFKSMAWGTSPSNLTKFKEFVWPEDSKDTPYNYFSWPDITFSENVFIVDPTKIVSTRSPINYPNCFDLLGSFTLNTNNKGLVTLYLPSIMNAVNEFIEEDKVNRERYFREFARDFCMVILLHEFAHWIVESLSTQDGKDYDVIRYSTSSEIDFHETLAQYLTYKGIVGEQDGSVKYPKLKKVFDWLLSSDNTGAPRQPKQYHLFKEFTQIPTKHMIVIIECTRKENRQDYQFIQEALEHWRLDGGKKCETVVRSRNFNL